MSAWFGWTYDKGDKTYKLSNANSNFNTGNIFNDSITTTFKESNFLDKSISTFRDTATFTINPFDEKHAVDKILPGIRPGSFGEEEDKVMSMEDSVDYFRELCDADDKKKVDFQEELVEKLNDREFQAAARQRYKILAGITNVKPTGKYLEMNQFGHIAGIHEEGHVRNAIYQEKIINTDKIPTECDDSLQCDSAELPTRRAGKTIKELTQELQYDLERARDVKTREDLIMRCSRYIRLERMSESLNDLT